MKELRQYVDKVPKVHRSDAKIFYSKCVDLNIVVKDVPALLKLEDYTKLGNLYERSTVGSESDVGKIDFFLMNKLNQLRGKWVF